jgi:anti-sigma-K factor RskA
VDAETVHELSAAYVLDALEPEEREAFEEHLPSCASCQEEVADLSLAASELVWAAEPAVPSPELRERILEAARAERPNVVPLRPRRVSRVWAVAAVAACVAIGLAIWDVSLHNQLSDARSVSLQRVPVAGLQGSVVVGSGGSAALVAFHLPAAPAGKTYEAWVIPKGKSPAPAGLFKGGAPATFVPLNGKVPTGSQVAVTVEPAGGSAQPTSKPFAVSDPV